MTKIDGQTKKPPPCNSTTLRDSRPTTSIFFQFHEVIRMTDPQRISAPAGGMEAVLEARKAGKVRFIGFTAQKSEHAS